MRRIWVTNMEELDIIDNVRGFNAKGCENLFLTLNTMG